LFSKTLGRIALEESAKIGLRKYSEISFFPILSVTSFPFFLMLISGPLLHELQKLQPLLGSDDYKNYGY
jgi:hypothetical protein